MADGTSLLRIIKKAAVEAVENSKPLAICGGIVIKEKPLEIKVAEQELILDSDFFIFVLGLGEMKKGDKLLLIRKQGGQKYYVINRLL